MKQIRGAKSLSQISLRLGYTKDWLSATKYNSTGKFEFMMSFDEDKYLSIIKAQDYIETLTNDVQNIFYEFNRPADFHRWLENNDVIPADCTKQYGYSFEKQIFTFCEPLNKSIKSIKKLEQLRNAWEANNVQSAS